MRIRASLDEMLQYIGSHKTHEFVEHFGAFGIVARERGLKIDENEQKRYDNFLDGIIRSVPKNPHPYYESINQFLAALTLSDPLNHLLHEFIYNSICHGNNFNINLAVTVKIFDGKNGYVIRIEDKGKGFDVDTTLRKRLYERGGVGLSDLKMSPFYWSYENNGSVLNLLKIYNPLGRIGIRLKNSWKIL